MEHYVAYIFNHPLDKVIFTDDIEIVVDNIPCRLDYSIEDREIYTDDNFSEFETYYNKHKGCDNNLWDDFNPNVDITLELIEKFIRIILDTLDNIKFSKIKGMFVSKEYCRKQICQKMVFGKFMKSENEDESNKCSVCFDSTETRTHCGHTLCFPC